MKTIKTNEALGILMIVAVMLFAGCTSNQAPNTTTTTPSAGILISQSPRGSIITDDSSMSLYTFDNDEALGSNCNGQCAVTWPPLIVSGSGPSPVPENLKPDISILRRDDGTNQAAYKGMPLYYYSGDSKPGDMNGDGTGGLWHIAMINSNQTTTSKGSTQQTTTTRVTTQPTTTKTVTPTTFIGSPRTVNVLINVFGYDPSPLTVTVGDTVVWKSMQTQMTVTSPGNASERELDSPTLGPGETYSHTFTKVGAYNYYSTTNERVNGRIYVTSDLNASTLMPT